MFPYVPPRSHLEVPSNFKTQPSWGAAFRLAQQRALLAQLAPFSAWRQLSQEAHWSGVDLLVISSFFVSELQSVGWLILQSCAADRIPFFLGLDHMFHYSIACFPIFCWFNWPRMARKKNLRDIKGHMWLGNRQVSQRHRDWLKNLMSTSSKLGSPT